MRFHPVIIWLKENMDNLNPIETQVYCGSYLPEWRPGRDYRNTYSANEQLGGGVHLDLIHEMDYVKWIFGKPLSIKGSFYKISNLKIDSADLAHYWLEYEKHNVSIILNYYRRLAKRQIEFVTNEEVYLADILNFKVYNSENELVFDAKPDLLISFENQMKYFLDTLKGGNKFENDFDAALQTLELTLSGC
jgi:predicted dehydrogenase